jgi:MFS family permease
VRPLRAFGAVVAVWQVQLAELVERLGLGLGLLGATLTLGSAISLPVMLAAGRRADRAGTGALLGAACAVVVAGLLAYAAAGSAVGFVLASVIFLAGFGAYDVAVNARAVGIEVASGRGVLAPAYAAFSAGAAVAAGATGLALGAGVSFRMIFVAAAVLLVAALVATPRVPAPAPRAAAMPAPGAPALPVPGPGGASGALRDRRVALLAAIVALAFIVQGTLEQWSSVYLRTELELSAGLAASGLTAFHLAMLAGRLGGVALCGRVARWVLLTGGGAAVAAGMGLALATTTPAVVVAGIALVGAASAVVVPTATSLAGERTPERPGGVAAALAITGYTAALLAPGVVGGLAELSGLRAALGVVAVAGLGVAFLGALAARRP